MCPRHATSSSDLAATSPKSVGSGSSAAGPTPPTHSTRAPRNARAHHRQNQSAGWSGSTSASARTLGEQPGSLVVGDEVEVARRDVDAPDGERGAAGQPPVDADAVQPLQEQLERVAPGRRPEPCRLEHEFLEVLSEPQVRAGDFGRADAKGAPKAGFAARETKLRERRPELARDLRDDEARAVDPGLQGSYVSRSGSPSRARHRVSASWSCSGSPMSSHSPSKT